MKFSLLQESLVSIIQDLQKSVPSRPSLPVLSCVLIEASEEGAVTFSATDLNLGVRSTTRAKVSEKGVAAVPAKVFFDALHSFDVGEVELFVQDQTLFLSSGKVKVNIQCFQSKDYPPFPEKEGEEIRFSVEQLLKLTQLVAFAASVDEARPVLTTVLFVFGEALEVVATDGFRLTTLQIADPPRISEELQEQIGGKLLIPAKALQEAARLVQRKKLGEIKILVSPKLKQLFFEFDTTTLLVRLMEGDFPPYEKIIPADFQTQTTFSAEEFSQRLKTAMIFARDASGIIRFIVEKEELKILSSSSALGQQEGSLTAVRTQGEDIEIAFNAKYVQEFLSVVKPERIFLGVNESLKPALFRPEGEENYRYIVMPFRVNQ